jgi:Tfp pilus assembly protein PilW
MCCGVGRRLAMKRRIVGRPAGRAVPGGQAGFTITERIVWVGVAIVVLAAGLTSYLGSKRSWETTASLARIQRDGSVAMEMMARAVRHGSSVEVVGDSLAVYYWTGSVDSLLGCFYLDDDGYLRDAAGVSIASDVDSVRFVTADNQAINIDLYLREDMNTPDRSTDDQMVLISTTAVCRN